MKLKIFKTLLALAISILCNAQSGKRKIMVANYSKWGTLSENNISSDGKWVSYKMEYENSDTLFIQGVNKKIKYCLPQANEIIFNSKGNCAVVSFKNNELCLLDLNSGTRKTFKNVLKHSFSNDGMFLLIQQQSNADQYLSIICLQDNTMSLIQNVSDFKLSAKDNLAIITNAGLSISNSLVDNSFMEIARDAKSIFKNLIWSKSGGSLAFLRVSKQNPLNQTITYFNNLNKEYKELESSRLKFANIDYLFTGNKLIIDDTEQILYFKMKPAESISKKTPVVEIWETSSALEFPGQAFLNDWQGNSLLGLWDIEKNKIIKLDADTSSISKILPGAKDYLSFSTLTYEPQYAETSPVDYFLHSCDSDKSKLIIEKGSASANAIMPSPSGRYIGYFRDSQYFVYDKEKDISIKITADLDSIFYNIELDRPSLNEGYGSPGWTDDERFLIVYDQFDIWFISPDGKVSKKITSGRENQTRFRIIKDIYLKNVSNFAEFSKYDLNIEKGLILSAFSADKSKGYYFYSEKTGIQKLVHNASKMDRIKKAANKEIYCYIEQTEKSPPKLMVMQKDLGKIKSIFQSNPHYKNFEWPHSELITYKNSKGILLQGILIYPVNYISGIKYPMITYIYEKLSQDFHEYLNPITRHRIGFSPSTYFLDGYFVFLPDIEFEIKNPGPSAVDCVTSSIKEILGRGLIDKNKIGIVGHSFGGYEVSYIVTQTNIFKAAVAGAAVTDIFSWYHTINFTKNRSNAWALESQQFRMGTTPFDSPEVYQENSPLANASKISTPLLNWSGKDDQSVNYEQSIELHLALRRLNKPGKLLLYPGQGHILTNNKAQEDLTLRIKEWFDYYLRGIQAN